jgi:hypothetical protein
MTSLDRWLERATWCLSEDSTGQVRKEIQEHYESEREAAIGRGIKPEEAERLAVASLGSAKTANREYRKVLLTSEEARVLRHTNREAGFFCSGVWLKWTLLAVPVGTLLAAFVLFFNDKIEFARVLLVAGIAMGFIFAAPFLPVYTPSRGRVYRIVKWALLVSAICLVYGQDTVKYSWLWASCLWIPIWTEWTRVSIRRKLPVAEWPKQLYL